MNKKEEKKLNFGIIGCGEISRQHAVGIQQAQNAKLAMVMDKNEEAAKDMAEKYNVPYTTKLEDMLSSKEIDAVSIATPHFLHLSITCKAAKAKKHIIIEKPVGISIKEVDEIDGVCRKEGVKASVWFVYRYNATMKNAKKLIESGAIGNIIGIKISAIGLKDVSYWTRGVSGKARSTDWRAYLNKAGGGVLIMNAIHLIDAMRFITGLEVKRVFSQYGTFVHQVEVEDFIAAVLRYDNGALGSIDAATCAKGSIWTKPGTCPLGRIYGEDGQIIFSEPMRVFTTKKVEGLKQNDWIELPITGPDARILLVEDFVKAVGSGKEPPITISDGRSVQEIVEAAYISGRENRAVELPL